MNGKLMLLLLLLIPVFCKTNLFAQNSYPARIADITLPNGFDRIQVNPRDFSFWLRQRPLKKSKTVYLFNGQKKANQEAQYAVLDIPVGSQNLQQCADAVMRLRAEWLFAMRRYNEINFSDANGKSYPFTTPYTREHFERYLQTIFVYCGSASLAKQLRPEDFKNILPGDVIIRGGFPGHAVIVMDMAVDKQGSKIYLLAQSYMPAQDIHVLKNPADLHGGPWYKVTDHDWIITPEYRFRNTELRRWP